jgi:hypothetical protein
MQRTRLEKATLVAVFAMPQKRLTLRLIPQAAGDLFAGWPMAVAALAA